MDQLKQAERLYDRLLLVYPAPYRQRFGGEMRQTFRDLYRDHMHSGEADWRFWIAALVDLVTSAFGQYVEIIRSQPEMKQFFSNSADYSTLLIGIILMIPAGLFFIAGSIVQLLNLPSLNGLYAGHLLDIFTGLFIVAPLLAVVLNAVPLVSRIVKSPGEVLRWSILVRYFWTFAIMAAGLLWIAFVYGHDTIACAAHFLPLLQWQSYRHCVAIH